MDHQVDLSCEAFARQGAPLVIRTVEVRAGDILQTGPLGPVRVLTDPRAVHPGDVEVLVQADSGAQVRAYGRASDRVSVWRPN